MRYKSFILLKGNVSLVNRLYIEELSKYEISDGLVELAYYREKLGCLLRNVHSIRNPPGWKGGGKEQRF